MNKLIASPNKNKLGQDNSRIHEPTPLAQSPFSGGMVTNIPAIDLDNNQSLNIVNFEIYLNRTRKRFGTSFFVAVKPDANKILGLTVYAKADGTVKFVRFTKNSVSAAGVGLWTAIVGAALLGTDDDYFDTINVDDRLLFTNNGVDVIQEIDTLTDTYAPLGNAPAVKYLAAFGDRVLGFYSVSPLSATYVAWSGNRNYGEWNPLVDISAGFTTLTNTGEDLADPIVGAVVFTNTLQIFRNKSIWEATITNSFSQPFYFYQKIPGIGCDCPQSIVKIPGGACFVDTYSQGIYYYAADGQIKNIGEPIIKDFLSNISNRNNVIGSYSYKYSRYQILIISTDSPISIVWEYNFKSDVWVKKEYTNLSYIADLEFGTGTLTIDELLGNIDDLLGTIDSLGGSPDRKSTMFQGTNDGEILSEDLTTDKDNGIDYTAVIESKLFELPIDAAFVVELNVEFKCTNPSGNITIQYRKDNKTDWITYKTLTWSVINDRVRITAKKNVRCRNYQFRILSTSGLLEIEKYAVLIDSAGESKI